MSVLVACKKALVEIRIRLYGRFEVFHCYGGAIVNRTYGLHKNLYIKPFLLTVFGPVNYGPP